jgi:hypothetical protein
VFRATLYDYRAEHGRYTASGLLSVERRPKPAYEAFRRRTAGQWNRYGEIDPYFGVVSHERFRRENLDDTAVAAFFRSGQAHVDWLAHTIPDRAGAAFAPRRTLTVDIWGRSSSSRSCGPREADYQP